MKRMLSCGLALSLVLGLLSSCAKPAGETDGLPALDPQNPVSIEIWHYYNGPQKSAFETMIGEFNDTVGMEQGIIVEAFSQGNVDGLITKVTDAAQKKVGADEVPNIFAAYADTAYEVNKLGLVADLSPYLTQDELSEYHDAFLDEGYVDGTDALQIFPIAKSVELMMLNTTDWQKFADATGASLDALSTIEGVTSTAQAYYQWTDGLTPDVPDDGKAFFGRDAMANYMIAGSRQLGVELFQVTGNQVTLNLDKGVMRQLWDNYYVPYINGWFTAGGRFRSDDAHIGDIVALVGSSSGATYFPTEVTINDLESYPIDGAFFPAPTFAQGEPYAIQQGAGLAITKSDPATEYACTLFLKWFTEAERNVAFSVSSGYLPVKKAALDPELVHAELSASGVGASMEAPLDAALQELEQCTLYTTRAFEGGNAARSVLEHALSDKAAADRAAIEALMTGGLSRQEAVAQYDTDANFDAWYDQLAADLNAACAG